MKKIKITKEQYSKIAKMLKEDVEIPNMSKKVDKSFKQAFVGKNVENLKEDGADFKIDKPIPKMSSSVQGSFMKEGETDLKHETLELIKYLYRKSEEFSPFWAEHDLTYDDICDALESKGIIIKKDGKYELSKSLGSAEEAKQAVEDELSQMIGSELTEYNQTKESEYNEVFKNADIKIFEDNKGDLYLETCDYEGLNETEMTEPNGIEGMDILKHEPISNLPDTRAEVDWKNRGSVYLSSLDTSDSSTHMLSKEDIVNYIEMFNQKYGEDPIFTLNPNAPWFDKVKIINTTFNKERDRYTDIKAATLKSWGTTNEQKIKIDDSIKNELLGLYDKDSKLTEILKGVNEMDMGDIKSKLAEPFKQQPSGYEEKSPEEREMIKQRLAAIRAKSQAQDAERFAQRDAANAASANKGVTSKTLPVEPKKPVGQYNMFGGIDEMGTAGAMGGTNTGSVFGTPSNAPVGKFGEPLKRTFKGELNEMTQGEDSIGQYTMPAFKMKKNHTDFAEVNPKAFQKTQWADGSFVEFDDCTKLNNNKKAQKGGCSTGAVDNVVKQRKTKSNVNAPSLSENQIYETIAKKTGKTIEEVKRIIETKKNK